MLERETDIHRKHMSAIAPLWGELVGNSDRQDEAENEISSRFGDQCLRKVYTLLVCGRLEELYSDKRPNAIAKMIGKHHTTYGRYRDEAHDEALPLTELKRLVREYGKRFVDRDMAFPPEEEVLRHAGSRAVDYFLRNVVGDERDIARFGREEYEFLCLTLESDEWQSAVQTESLPELQKNFCTFRSAVPRPPQMPTERVLTCGQLLHLWEVWRDPFLLALEPILMSCNSSVFSGKCSDA
jgi:hypothetical protein